MGARGFLIDEDLPTFIAPALRLQDLAAVDIREAGFRGAADSVVAVFAKDNNLAILSGDFGFANVKQFPPAEYHGIAVFEFPNAWTATPITRLVVDYARQPGVLGAMNGRLAIVSPGRVRYWPAAIAPL